MGDDEALAAALLLGAAAWWVWRRGSVVAVPDAASGDVWSGWDAGSGDDGGWWSGGWDDLQAGAGDLWGAMMGDDVQDMTGNRRAMLDTIAWAEGTVKHGYRTLFGGSRWGGSMALHPYRQGWPGVRGDWLRGKPGLELTTAAGRYQFVVGTWERVAGRLGLQDFDAASQDAAALDLIRARGALGDVDSGRFDAAVRKLAAEWASLPGGDSGQAYRSLADLRRQFVAAGGVLA